MRRWFVQSTWYTKCIRKSSLPATETALYPCGRTPADVSQSRTEMPGACHRQKVRSRIHHRIGCKLSDGKKHDGRAPDYDDYTTPGLNGLPGLNGDLLLWDDVLQRSVELSSMGIRVDKEALQRQLKQEGEEKRLELYFHKRLMGDALPLSIGGGIGQSRLCMFYLRKAHIERYKPASGLKTCARNARRTTYI